MSLCPALLLTLGSASFAQNNPRIGYVYPAGGRQGETFQVVVGGQFLDGVSEACLSDAGIEATVIEHTKPLTQKQFTELREKLKELEARKAAATKGAGQEVTESSTQPAQAVEWTAADEEMLAEVRKKLRNPPNRQANPALAEAVTLTVTLAPDIQPGEYELRLRTPRGLSNPLIFCVGQLPEFSEKESRDRPPQRPGAQRLRDAAGTEMQVTLPATVNGQILPGGVDRFRFTAQKGMRLVAAVSARELIPYLADAVPGWFQATLALYDADGHELAYADDYRFNPDPVLYYEVPEDGEYVLEIRDSIYRGREDFVYRIALGELPFVTSIFPLGGRAGEQTPVELRGWNLPTNTLTPEVEQNGPGVYPFVVHAAGQVSNPVLFAVDTLPECLEQEGGDEQSVTTPIIVNGRIDRPGDNDVFRFEGRAGSEIVAEVYARRLNSPLDPVLRLTDATGRQLAADDDREDKSAGLLTHQADSWLCATLPADGTYYLHLRDAQDKGGPAYGYRLRISPPRPDFDLRVVPSSVNARGGANIPLTVYAIRRDGFAGEIALALKDAPAGFSLSGTVPAGQDKTRITLAVPPGPVDEPVSLSLIGLAVIDNRQVVHSAVPAEDMMQAFFYRHLVPARELEVTVSGRGGGRGIGRILSSTPIKIPVGGTARVQMAGRGNARGGQALPELELNEPPEGIDIQEVTSSGRDVEIVLHSDAAKTKPGLRGNLIVNVFPPRPPAAANQRPQANRRRVPATVLPAIPFETVEP
jgi:hypothetical protein